MKIAIIQIRGLIGVNRKIKDTLRMFNLPKKNSCVIVDNSLQYIGMIRKTKDYITWGEISEETIKLLLEKRGKLPASKPLTEQYCKEKLNLTIAQFAKEISEEKKKIKDLPGLKSFFRLHPPIGGFEKGGIKTPFSLGGVLGYRKDKINELIKKMI